MKNTINKQNNYKLKMRKKMDTATCKGLLVRILIGRTVRRCSWMTILGIRVIQWQLRLKKVRLIMKVLIILKHTNTNRTNTNNY